MRFEIAEKYLFNFLFSWIFFGGVDHTQHSAVTSGITKELLLVVQRRPNKMLGIEPRLTVYKVNALHIIILL